MPRIALALLVAALSLLPARYAFAQTPMTAAEFEAYVEGRTLYFGLDGEAYGAEEYLSDRRVRWSFLDGECKDGFWYPEDEQICFVYEDRPEPQCWTFYRAPDGLRAIFENDPASTVLYEAQDANEPLQCPGPEVGV